MDFLDALMPNIIILLGCQHWTSVNLDSGLKSGQPVRCVKCQEDTKVTLVIRKPRGLMVIE
jgi:hypothetical protein